MKPTNAAAPALVTIAAKLRRVSELPLLTPSSSRRESNARIRNVPDNSNRLHEPDTVIL